MINSYPCMSCQVGFGDDIMDFNLFYGRKISHILTCFKIRIPLRSLLCFSHVFLLIYYNWHILNYELAIYPLYKY